MGNYRFRLSNMIPNAWFYKLKYMTSRPGTQYKTTAAKNNKQHTSSSSSRSSLSISSSSSASLVAATAAGAAAPNHGLPKIAEQPHLSDQRKSYYFTRDLTNTHHNSPTKNRIDPDKHFPTEPPRKSSRRRRSTKRNRLVSSSSSSSSISAGCSCRATLESVWTKPPDNSTPYSPDSLSEHDSILPECGSDSSRTDADLERVAPRRPNSCIQSRINDMNHQKQSSADFDRVHNLPPIITKKHSSPPPTKVQRTSAEFTGTDSYRSLSVKVIKEEILSNRSGKSHDQQHKAAKSSPVRRLSSNAGMKLRTNSPRIANLRSRGRRSTSSNTSCSGSRGSLQESLAVVKSSKDPRRDFRESMVEMIVENNIRASKDMEELLACYLTLNSDEYHGLIINVFKQIWFDFIHVGIK